MIDVQDLRKVAVVVRTHVVEPKVETLLAALSSSSLFDLYVFADETNRTLDFGPYAKISHSLASVEELGFGVQPLYYLNHCADVLFAHLLRSAPGYDHYVMIEFDVHLARGDSAFVDMLVRALSSPAYSDVDMTCIALRGSNPKWMWHAASAAFFDKPQAIFFPFVSLTPRAIEYCYKRRLDERELRGPIQPESNADADNLVFCETFLPSAMRERGFRSVDIAEMFPGCYRWPAFNEGPPRLLGDLQLPDPTVEIVHPVVEPRPFLEKYLFWARGKGKLPELLEDLRAGRWALPPDLAAEYAAKIEVELGMQPQPDQTEQAPASDPDPVEEVPVPKERPPLAPYAEDHPILPPVGLVRDFVRVGGPNIDAWRYWMADVADRDEEGRYARVLRDTWPLPDTINREGYCDGDHLAYWLSGLADHLKTVEAAARYGVNGGKFYELGGGTGRVYRHFAIQSDVWEVWSSDFRRSSVHWSETNFPSSVRVFANTSAPSLALPDGAFDLVGAYSVFTHINEGETDWLFELRRILKPGGLAYISIHDEETWRTEEQLRRAVAEACEINPYVPLPQGRTVAVWREDGDPYNCNVFHSQDYIRSVWGRFFEVLEIKPKWVGAQAAVLLRRS